VIFAVLTVKEGDIFASLEGLATVVVVKILDCGKFSRFGLVGGLNTLLSG
jgi:hypothetical protein